MKKIKHLLKSILFTFIVLLGISWTIHGFAASIPLEIFPLKNYDQNVDHWIKPSDPNYKKPLVDLSYQKERLQEFYNHFFSTDKDGLSPWGQEYIEKILNPENANNSSTDSNIEMDVDEDANASQATTSESPENIYALQSQLLKEFSNEDQTHSNIGYGENYRPHHKSWIDKIANNMNVEQFKTALHFNPDNRGITVQNAYVRVLPTMDPHFYHFGIPGQGYPFDNLQMTDIWAGTPLYVIGETKDKHWSLIVSPDVTGWVQSEAVARVDQKFIDVWQKKAKQSLIAITHTEAPIFYSPNQKPLLRAYVGSVFPFVSTAKLSSKLSLNTKLNAQDVLNDVLNFNVSNVTNLTNVTHNPYHPYNTYYKILVPVKSVEGNAVITEGFIKKEHAAPMPLAATPQNFSKLIKTLQNRLYGWGGLYFYNDCSQELKSLYTPFGIYLPRHSSAQADAGKMVDMSSKSMDERIKYLMDEGRPMMTIVYIGNHVFMYLGNYPNPNSKTRALMPLTYQNMWGLKPSDLSRRSIIGQSLLFPLLKSYPEDPQLNSPANSKSFQIIYLNQWPISE